MTAVPKYQWQPSTAEIAARAGIAVEDVVRFDHNTSPYRPDWVAGAAADATAFASEYPAADYRPLREAAAGYAGVAPEQVMVGAGADELIILAARAFLAPGGAAVADEPSYSLYRIATLQQGATYETVPRRGPGFELPVGRLTAAAERADLVWLCQPHNPTGLRNPDADIHRVLDAAAGVVVLDAAYAEFTGDRWGGWLDRYPNLVVLHTLSKAHGLASIRVGYSLASVDRTAALDAIRPPGSISSVSAALAIRALGDPGAAARTVSALIEERAKLADRLAGAGFRPIAGDANFVLCEVGPHAHDLEAHLMAEGLVVRKYAAGGPLADYLRFTVRTPADHDRLLDAIERNLP